MDDRQFIRLDEDGVHEVDTRLAFNGGQFTVMDLPPEVSRFEITSLINMRVLVILALVAFLPLAVFGKLVETREANREQAVTQKVTDRCADPAIESVSVTRHGKTRVFNCEAVRSSTP